MQIGTRRGASGGRRWISGDFHWCFVALLIVFAFANSTSIVSAAKCPDKPFGIVLEPTELLNVGAVKRQALNYKCFGAYDRDVARVLADALTYVEKRSSEVTNAALVLDIDETSLSNWDQILANDFGYIPSGPCNTLPDGPCGVNDWELNHVAPGIAPTLALFRAAKTKGVAIFFITGRPDTEQERSATTKNLIAVGYEGWEGLILRPQGYSSAKAYKTAQREEIAKRFTIIANVGDQQSDLDGGYAERTYRVPNPFYYIE